jgi:hypothetical protein
MITVLLIVLWLQKGTKVEAITIPEGIECGDVAVAYIAHNVTGNPNITDATWSCFDVPRTPEKAS